VDDEHVADWFRCTRWSVSSFIRTRTHQPRCDSSIILTLTPGQPPDCDFFCLTFLKSTRWRRTFAPRTVVVEEAGLRWASIWPRASRRSSLAYLSAYGDRIKSALAAASGLGSLWWPPRDE